MRRRSIQERVRALRIDGMTPAQIGAALTLPLERVAHYLSPARKRRDRAVGRRRYQRRVECEIIEYRCGACGGVGHNRRSCPQSYVAKE